MDLTVEQKEGLKKLREPFLDHQISKLPKPSREQTEAVKADFKAGFRCGVCNGWHHPKAVHLDYVGHAALTDRLLSVDPEWNWRPLAVDGRGLPVVDEGGGLWIELTLCGVTRLGYGDAQGKTGGDAMKERIGDALRNAGMRFGAALDLWHKGDLHRDDTSGDEPAPKPLPPYPAANIDKHLASWQQQVAGSADEEEIIRRMNNIIGAIQSKYTLTDEQKARIIDTIYPGRGKDNV